MFDLSEAELTWQVVGQWTTKESDRDYSVSIAHQPMGRMDTLIGSTYYSNGKPYKVHLMYFLKGLHLFIATLRHEGDDSRDFESKQLIDLSTIDLMTKPLIRVRPRLPLSLFSSERMEVYGEKFFLRSNSVDLQPYLHSFTLRYPEDGYKCQWEDALKFSSTIKHRIYKNQQKEGEQDAPSNR